MKDIELRDFLASQLMVGKVDVFYGQAHRKNIAKEGEPENYVLVNQEEAIQRGIERSVRMAYRIADVMLKVRNDDVFCEE